MARNSNSEYWKQVIKDQTSSGLVQVKWCEQNDVNIHNFRYWKNKIKRDENSGQKSTTPTWALVTANPDSKSKAPESKTGEIEIQIGKVNMTLRNSVDTNLFSDVIKVLMNYA